MNEEILNTRGDQAFYMGAENAKIESAEKSAETGGHQGGGRGVVGVVYPTSHITPWPNSRSN
jgi:hypothetical protein